MLLFSVLRLSVGRIDPISYINTTVQAFGLHCFCILLYCGGPPLLDIRVCNTPKKREPCHVDRAHATRHLFMACRGRYIPLQFLTLMLLSFILFVVFLSCTFWCVKKYQKRPAQSKNSRNVLRNVDNTALSHPVQCKLRLHCARLYAGGIVDLQANSCHTVSTQPNIACRLSLFVSVQALRDLCGLALLKNITLPHFKHVLAYS